jgi:hypothetical protein
MSRIGSVEKLEEFDVAAMAILDQGMRLPDQMIPSKIEVIASSAGPRPAPSPQTA